MTMRRLKACINLYKWVCTRLVSPLTEFEFLAALWGFGTLYRICIIIVICSVIMTSKLTKLLSWSLEKAISWKLGQKKYIVILMSRCRFSVFSSNFLVRAQIFMPYAHIIHAGRIFHNSKTKHIEGCRRFTKFTCVVKLKKLAMKMRNMGFSH